MDPNLDFQRIDDTFKDFLKKWLKGRRREELTDLENERLFFEAEEFLRREHKAELWDYLASTKGDKRSVQDDDEKMFSVWQELYAALEEVAQRLEIEVYVSQDFTGLPEISVTCDRRHIPRLYKEMGKLDKSEYSGFSVRFLANDSSIVVGIKGARFDLFFR